MSKTQTDENPEPSPSTTAFVVAGGDRPDVNTIRLLPTPVFVIAADSGVDHARSLGLSVDAVVGDLDSATPGGLDWARSNGAEIDSHPRDKDQTDLALALAKAAQWAEDGCRSSEDAGHEADGSVTKWTVTELVVLGLDGGRIDHWLANLLTLAGPLSSSVPITAYLGPCRVTVIRETRSLWGRPGEVVTILAIGGPAEGVTTEGLVYQLTGDRLDAASSQGVSNVFKAAPSRSETDGDNESSSISEAASESGIQLDKDRTDPLADAVFDTASDRGVGGEYGGMVSAKVTVKSGTLLALQPYALSGAGPAHPPTPTPQDA